MKRSLLPLIIAAFFAGCATPSQEDLARADYGPYPSDYESIVKRHLSNSLKDPDSAQYRFLNTPKSGWNGLGGVKYGWIVCAQVNAKNSYGGYVGFRPAYFMIKNGLVIDATVGDGNYGDAIAQGKCQKFI